MYHKCQLPAISVPFRAEVRLNSIDDAFVETRVDLVDEQPDLCPGGVIMSLLPAAGEDEGD